MIKLRSFTKLLILLLFIVGCDCPNSPVITGNLTGRIALYDEYGNRLSNKSGIEISLENTPHITHSDSVGVWLIKYVEMGKYNVIIYKNGYGVYKRYEYNLLGGGDNYFGIVDLLQIPSFTITNINVEIRDPYKDIYVTGTVSSLDIYQRKIRLFIGLTGSVSSDPENYFDTYYSIVNSNAIEFNLSIDNQFIKSKNIESGTRIYIIAYATSFNDYVGNYYDHIMDKTIYSSLNNIPSNTVSIIVP